MVYQGTLIVYSVSLCTNVHYIIPYRTLTITTIVEQWQCHTLHYVTLVLNSLRNHM